MVLLGYGSNGYIGSGHDWEGVMEWMVCNSDHN